MDDIRDLFSRMKKKIKHRITGRKRKPDGTGADTPGERPDSPGSLPPPEPRVVAGGGQDPGGNGANTDGQQTYSTDQRREAEIGERGSSQRHSYLDSDVDATTGSRRSGEVGRVYPSPSTPQISNSGKSDST